MKKLNPEMEKTGKGRRGIAIQRSTGKASRKKFSFSGRAFTNSSKVVGMKLPLDSSAAEAAEAEYASLIATRDELKDNLANEKKRLLKFQAIEAFMMLKLGFL